VTPEVTLDPPGMGTELNSILVVHNRYRQSGGEDAVFEAEADLLAGHGHRVERLVVDNDAIPARPSPAERLRLGLGTVWSRASARAVADRATAVTADVVHIHNFLPLLSPAIHGAARSTGAAVVQTLHNYRLICPAATLFRDGAPCEDCVGLPIALPAVVHACYRDARLPTATVAAMLAVHRARRTWHRDVDAFIALTSFGRARFIAGGLPRGRLFVKPNFVPDPGAQGEGDPGNGDSTQSERFGRGPFLFVGRLAHEKGIRPLLAAWRLVGHDRHLRIVGDGPLADDVRSAVEGSPGITFVGRQSPDQVRTEMQSAAALVVPSLWYEGMPLSLIEALAAGLPVIASRLGAMAAMIADGATGLLVTPGDPTALAGAVERFARRPDAAAAMGAAARRAYLETYAPAANYAQLTEIYRRAVVNRSRRPGPVAPAGPAADHVAE